MAKSDRKQFTLNPENPRDIVIANFLKTQFNKSDFIKDVLYAYIVSNNLSINTVSTQQNAVINTVPSLNNTVNIPQSTQQDTSSLQHNTVNVDVSTQHNTANIADEIQKINSIVEVSSHKDNSNIDDEELNKNVLEGLDKYF